MLVLFIYITSVASNEKFKYSLNLVLLIRLSIISIIIISIFIDFYFININSIIKETININLFNRFSLRKFLNYPNNIILFIIITYLFITLIAVVKITNIKIGPLRQKN